MDLVWSKTKQLGGDLGCRRHQDTLVAKTSFVFVFCGFLLRDSLSRAEFGERKREMGLCRSSRAELELPTKRYAYLWGGFLWPSLSSSSQGLSLDLE